MLWWMMWSVLAFADDLVLLPEVEVGAERSIKLDLFYFAPGVHPYGDEWTPSAIEQWTAALDCVQTEPKIETCTFRDNTLWWGYVAVGGKQEFTYIRLPTPGTLEFTWTPRGRLATWDIKGDRSDFHKHASNAMLALYHRDDVVFKPDSQRRIGGRMEQALCRGFASILELELPRKGKTKAGKWKSKSPPWATRRYTQGVATGKFEYTLEGSEGAPTVSWNGKVAETPPGGSLTTYFVEGVVLGEAQLDPKTLRPVQARVETAYRSTTVDLEDHTRFLGLASPMPKDEVVQPSEFPGQRIQ